MNARRDFLTAAATASVGLTTQLARQKPTDRTPVFWAIVELMGHVKHAGRCSEVSMFGATFLRIEVPTADGSFVMHMIDASSGSVYRITPTTETMARTVALSTLEPMSAYAGGQRSLGWDDEDEYDHHV